MDLAELPNGRSEPSDGARHYLGRYDGTAHALVDLVELTPAGGAWLSAAWLEDRLLFVHGSTGAALSVFELAPSVN